MINQDLIPIQASTSTAVAAKAQFNISRVTETRSHRAGIDYTGGAALTEKNRIRSARDIDTIGVVTIPRNFRAEEITGVVRCSETADTSVLIRASGVFCKDRDGR